MYSHRAVFLAIAHFAVPLFSTVRAGGFGVAHASLSSGFRLTSFLSRFGAHRPRTYGIGAMISSLPSDGTHCVDRLLMRPRSHPGRWAPITGGYVRRHQIPPGPPSASLYGAGPPCRCRYYAAARCLLRLNARSRRQGQHDGETPS
jgi:hypothetical protein